MAGEKVFLAFKPFSSFYEALQYADEMEEFFDVPKCNLIKIAALKAQNPENRTQVENRTIAIPSSLYRLYYLADTPNLELCEQCAFGEVEPSSTLGSLSSYDASYIPKHPLYGWVKT